MICHEFKGGIGTASRVVDAGRGGYTSASWSRRTTASATGCASTASGSARRSRSRRCRARPATSRGGAGLAAAPARARSSSSSRPTRRCCPTSASGWPSGPVSASRAPAARAGTPAATCSSRSRPAIGLPRRRRRRVPRVDVRGPGRRRHGDRLNSSTRHRGDRGGHRQRARGRRDDGRPRRDHGVCPAPRSAPRGHGRATAGERRGRPMPATSPADRRRSWRPHDEPMDWPGLPGLGGPTSNTCRRGHGGGRRARRRPSSVSAARVAIGRDDVRFVTDLYVDPRATPGRRRGAARRRCFGRLGADDVLLRRSARPARSTSGAACVRGGRCCTWPAWAGICATAPASSRAARRVEESGATVGWPGRASTGARISRYYAALPDATGFWSRDAGPGRRRLGADATERGPRPVAGSRLDRAGRRPGPSALAVWAAAAPGSGCGRRARATPGRRRAAQAGVRIEDRDTFCATDSGLLDPVRVLPNPGLL